MRIIEDITEFAGLPKGCALTIGNFDGVHIGHQVIIGAGKKAAAKRQTQLAAMTFDPHPVAILHPEKSPGVLTPLSLKRHYLAEAGVDCLVVLKSTTELLGLSAEDFVDRFLVKGIGPSVVIEGEDFNFGRGRGGGIDRMQQLGAEKGFEVCVVGAKTIELSTGERVRVSSTMIRNLLEEGQSADAAVALGRAYRLVGQVVPGHGKGKELGFPTANLEPGRQIVPSEGVYAGLVEIGETCGQVCRAWEQIAAALSIGRARTLGDDRPRLIEAHLLTENVGDLVGKWLAMDFVQKLRGQIRFESEKELAGQIAKDCEKARDILATEQSD
jgi:riboflavin kinase/FMN adenylyltransferase